MAKCILRNDYWCKGLGQTQPKSDAWKRFKEMRAAKKVKQAMPETQELFNV
jgi:predicted phosphoadenosine phosphosulfate sulfurtransferase